MFGEIEIKCRINTTLSSLAVNLAPHGDGIRGLMHVVVSHKSTNGDPLDIF